MSSTGSSAYEKEDEVLLQDGLKYVVKENKKMEFEDENYLIR